MIAVNGDNLEAVLAASIEYVKEKKMNGNGSLNGATVATTATPQMETAMANTTAAQHIGNGSTPEVYRAICKVAKEISRDGIAKGRRNEQQGYGFRGVDDVMNALSALLAGAELIILPRMRSRTQEERATAAGKSLFYVTVRACFDFVSARDGSRHTVIMYGEAMDSADKATNKAMSAAYKYACLQVFCIPTEGMADADQTTPVPEPKKTAPPAPTVKPEPKPMAPAAAVAERKIAAGDASSTPPWKTMGECLRMFATIREEVGEGALLAELERYGWHNMEELRKAGRGELINGKKDPNAQQKAIEIYVHLCAIARKQVA